MINGKRRQLTMTISSPPGAEQEDYLIKNIAKGINLAGNVVFEAGRFGAGLYVGLMDGLGYALGRIV